jgi:hypothetical protein
MLVAIVTTLLAGVPTKNDFSALVEKPRPGNAFVALAGNKLPPDAWTMKRCDFPLKGNRVEVAPVPHREEWFSPSGEVKGNRIEVAPLPRRINR